MDFKFLTVSKKGVIFGSANFKNLLRMYFGVRVKLQKKLSVGCAPSLPPLMLKILLAYLPLIEATATMKMT